MEILEKKEKFINRDRQLITSEMIKALPVLSKEIFIQDSICRWTPHFGNVDYPLNLPKFDCYYFLSESVYKEYNLRSTKKINANDEQDFYKIEVSRPLVYNWGGIIEITLYSTKFNTNHPTFYIMQRGNRMYLYSIGVST